MMSNQRAEPGPTTRDTARPDAPPDTAPDPRAVDDDREAGVVDPALIARAVAGEEEAWRELVSMYARRIYALAASRLRDRSAAEEVVQGVFATAAIKLRDGGYAEQGRFEAWLFRIAGNRVRDEIRRRRRAPDVQVLDAGAVAHENGSVEQADDMQLGRLRAAMGELNEQDREVIELRHHGGMGFKQMAELLSEPVGTLLARHHRALRKLRAMLERAPDETDDTTGARR